MFLECVCKNIQNIKENANILFNSLLKAVDCQFLSKFKVLIYNSIYFFGALENF